MRYLLELSFHVCHDFVRGKNSTVKRFAPRGILRASPALKLTELVRVLYVSCGRQLGINSRSTAARRPSGF